MIIVFGNQKGGCGKTTNCIQFANYLAERGIETLVVDLDFQRSLSDRRKEDIETYDNPPKYEVVATQIQDMAKLLDDFGSVEQGNLLIDLPGKIDDEDLATILHAADIIVCPFRYDKLTMDSTAFFIKIIQYLDIKAKLFFLPNNIEKSVRYDTKKQIIDILNKIGTVTQDIPQRVAMQRINTLMITNDCVDIVKSAYDCIIDNGNIK